MTAPVFFDRVMESSVTTGTGDYSLIGAVPGFQSFAAVADGGECYYCATDNTNWEIGLGTYHAGPKTLTRTTILASSNNGDAISWPENTKLIYQTFPAVLMGSISILDQGADNLPLLANGPGEVPSYRAMPLDGPAVSGILPQANGGSPTFETVAAATAYEPVTAPDYLKVAGYEAAGDGGAATYAKSATEPTPPGSFQINLVDSGSEWYGLQEYQVTPAMFGDVTTNDPTKVTPALQAAINYASLYQGELVTRRRTYMVEPDTSYTGAAGTTRTALQLQSNLKWVGGGATIKVKNGVSSDASPVSYNILTGWGHLQNIDLRDLVLDDNGQNNPISPNRSSLSYNRFDCSMITMDDLSGSPGWADDVNLEHIRFQNNPGVSCVTMMLTADTSAPTLGQRWRLKNCDFYNNGLDTDDQSCVFAFAEDVTGESNRFWNDKTYGQSGDTTGINTCWEIHGARQRLAGNLFRGSQRGIWVSSNYTNPTRGSRILGNVFQTLFYGVDFFLDRTTLQSIYDTIIANNYVEFDDTVISAVPGLTFKAAFQVASAYAQQDVSILGNRVKKTGTSVSSAAIVVSSGTVSGQIHDGIVSDGNVGTGLQYGTYTRTSATVGLGHIAHRNNSWFDLAPAGGGTLSAGDITLITTTAQPIASLELNGGSAIDRRGTPLMTHGRWLQGTFTKLTVRPMDEQNAVTAEYAETSVTVTTRKGSYSGSKTWDPPSTANGATTTTTVTVTGAALGMLVSVGFSNSLGGAVLSGYVSAANTVTAVLDNVSGGTLDLASGTLTATVSA